MISALVGIFGRWKILEGAAVVMGVPVTRVNQVAYDALVAGLASSAVSLEDGSPYQITETGKVYKVQDGELIPIGKLSGGAVHTTADHMKHIKDVASGTVTYDCYALPGTSLAAAGWKIKRTTIAGAITTVEWADGNLKFDNVANNRAALVYS